MSSCPKDDEPLRAAAQEMLEALIAALPQVQHTAAYLQAILPNSDASKRAQDALDQVSNAHRQGQARLENVMSINGYSLRTERRHAPRDECGLSESYHDHFVSAEGEAIAVVADELNHCISISRLGSTPVGLHLVINDAKWLNALLMEAIEAAENKALHT